MLLEISCELGWAGRIGMLPCVEPLECDEPAFDMLVDWLGLSFLVGRPLSSSSTSSSSSLPSSALLFEKSAGVFKSRSPSNCVVQMDNVRSGGCTHRKLHVPGCAVAPCRPRPLSNIDIA